MNLYATVTSERASKGQGGNEFIIVDLNIGREQVAQIELRIMDDIKEHGCDENEWLLQYRPLGSDDDMDWEIIAQGSYKPTKKKQEQKGKRQKDEKERCYKCEKNAMFATHSDKNGKTLPHARFTCKEHHYSE